MENFRERAREQCFARTRRPNHQNVALLDFNAGVRINARGLRLVIFRRDFRLDALVMIVNGDGQSLFRRFLPDAIKVKLAFDFRRFGHGELPLLLLSQHL